MEEPRNTFKFVASGGWGGLKRPQATKACGDCHRRKKRCQHNATETTPRLIPTGEQPRRAQTTSSPALPRPASEAIHTGERSYSNQHAQRADQEDHVAVGRNKRHEVSQNGGQSRYVGDLSPEAIFAAATSPDATRGQSLDDSIGVWVTARPNEDASQGTSVALRTSSNLFYGSSSLIQRVMVPMLEQECLSTLPSPSRFEALAKIYFEKVHPIFPVIDGDRYRILDPTGPESIILRQGICLAASKDLSAKHLLVLNDSESLFSCRQFGDKVSGSMRVSIEMGLVTNRLITIQALALMSQFTDTPVGEDISSQLCGRAVHYVQTLGLHLKGQQQEEIMDRKITTLLSCVWATDRMNAAINGRPVQMHERDIGKDLEVCFGEQEPFFRIFLEIVKLLDKVIDLYRPTSTSGAAAGLAYDFPAFEDIVMKCGGSHIGTPALITIETLYHAVAILSCRSKGLADPQRSSIAYLRQCLSTSILCSTVSRELYDQITLFPFVAYALSLSMSAAYREMRRSKLPLQRARSRAQFQTMCDALSELKGIFWSASATSEMGKKLLKEMDRVFAVVSSSEGRRERHSENTSTPANGLANQDTRSISAAFNEQHLITSAGQHNLGTQDFDPSMFDFPTDIDLFGMFDPAFDLDGFDAYLEGNLNPAYPTNFQ